MSDDIDKYIKTNSLAFDLAMREREESLKREQLMQIEQARLIKQEREKAERTITIDLTQCSTNFLSHLLYSFQRASGDALDNRAITPAFAESVVRSLDKIYKELDSRKKPHD